MNPQLPAGPLPALNDVRPEVAAFARLMEYKLRLNDYKGTWKSLDPVEVLRLLREEADKVGGALSAFGLAKRGVPGFSVDTATQAVAWEAPDVANFAMMIADITGGLDVVEAIAPATPAGENKDAAYHTLYYKLDHNTPAGEKITSRAWFESDEPILLPQEEYRTMIESAFTNAGMHLVKASSLTVAEMAQIDEEFRAAGAAVTQSAAPADRQQGEG